MSHEIFSLSQPQKRIWTTQKLFPGSSMFMIGGYVLIHREIDLDILKRAIYAFLSAHDSFQIEIVEQLETPQMSFSQLVPRKIESLDFSTGECHRISFQQWAEQQMNTPLSFDSGPLYQFFVFRLTKDCVGYFIKLHHIIADGWSIQIISNGILENYLCLKKGEACAALAPSYRSFLASEKEYLQSQAYNKDRTFWLEMFRDLPEYYEAGQDSIKGKRLSFPISEQISISIRQYCKERSISINVFFITVYLLFLYKKNDNSDVLLGLPLLGRSNKTERKILGMFVTPALFRYRLDSNLTIDALVQDVCRAVKKVLRHQRYPYNHLLKELNYNGNGIFKECLNYYHTSLRRDIMGIPVENFELYNGEQQYDRQLIVREWDDTDKIQLDVDYKTQLFTDEQIKDMYTRIMVIANELLLFGNRRIKEICLLTNAEREMFEKKYHKSHLEFSTKRTVLSMFLAQVKNYPHWPAVVDGTDSINFYDLNCLANAIASLLKAKGIKKGHLVGICTTPSIETVAGVLAVIKTGASYLPLDADIQKDRLSMILEEGGVEFLLTNQSISINSAQSIEIIHIDNSNRPYDIMPNEEICDCSPDDLAYVLFTSGTTGKPKGVAITHEMLYNYIKWAVGQYVTQPHEVLPLFTSMAFDLTITSLFLPLASAGTVMIYRNDVVHNAIEKIIQDNRCTIVKLTPAHLRLVNHFMSQNSSIQKFIVGGETLTVQLARQTYQNFNKHVLIYNEYGPTEATVGCMIYLYDVEKDKTGSVPIGGPIANTHVYLMDVDRNPVPNGWKGELYIAGKGVALGYLNRPEETKARFVRDDRYETGVLYRSGDYGISSDGLCMTYLGREDGQIKMNGYRIETQEVESQIAALDGIEQVVVKQLDIRDVTVLAAYYTGHAAYSEEEFHKLLNRKLPFYMQPSFFIKMDAFPMTANAKIDKKALPLPSESSSQDGRHIDRTVSEEEEILLECLSDLLKCQVLIADNFYRLGGDSIKAIQLASRLSEKNWDLKVNDILNHPLILDMADYIKRKTITAQELDCVVDDVIPLPVVQRFLKQDLAHPERYCQLVVLQFEERWPTDVLRGIQHTLIRHYNTLRLHIRPSNSQLYIEDMDETQSLRLAEYISEDNMTAEDIVVRCYHLIASMDYSSNSLFQTEVLLSGDKQYWLLAIHHLLTDGITWRILLEDIETLMRQAQHQQPLCLSREECPYWLWAERLMQNRAAFLDESLYWESVVQSVSSLSFKRASNICDMQHFEIPMGNGPCSLIELLREQGYANHITIEELLLAAFSLTIGTMLNTDRLPVELEGNGRNSITELSESIYRTIGWFTCLYPVILNIIPDNLTEYLKQVKKQLKAVPRHGLGYGILRDAEESNRLAENMVRFNYLGEFTQNFRGFHMIPQYSLMNFSPDAFSCLLELNCVLAEDRFLFSVRYHKECLIGKDISVLPSLLEENIQKLVRLLQNNEGAIIVPADFETSQISENDLDTLLS